MEIVILIGESKTVFYPSQYARIQDVINACYALGDLGIPARVEIREKQR